MLVSLLCPSNVLKDGQNDCGFGMQGPACSGNCGTNKTKHIKTLSIQEAEVNNCLINKI